MVWNTAERNMDGVEHEQVRKLMDTKFNAVHDELSDCYYNGKPFRTYGILDKATFDKLHGMIFDLRNVEFDKVNKSLPVEQHIPEEKYAAGLAMSVSRVAVLKTEGLELIVE